jgi:TPR repeat protein
MDNAIIQKGFKYLEKAVQLNYTKAYVSLGRCYVIGIGTNPNIEKARGMFKEGAELGDNEARL